MRYAKIEYTESTYFEDFKWQVTFTGYGRQWYKTKEEAEEAKRLWDEGVDYINDKQRG